MKAVHVRIDGKPFLALLGACTLALVVATVCLWPRLATAGPRRRISLLLAAQLSLATTFVFTVNAWGGFYTSWAQLLGTASAKYTLTDQGRADPTSADAHALRGLSALPALPVLSTLPAFPVPAAMRLTGPRSGLTADVQIYQPTTYASIHPLPVEVVDLTGGASGPPPSVYHQVADHYQTIVVLVTTPAPTMSIPSSMPSSIPGADVPGGAQGRLFWSQDLQEALRAHYRVAPYPSGWAVAGVGQNGAAAVNLAVEDPAHYGLAAAAGDWTHTGPQQSWPGLDQYLASVSRPDVSVLYDPESGNVPSELRTSVGAMRVTRRQGLTLTDELTWLGKSLDARVPLDSLDSLGSRDVTGTFAAGAPTRR